MRYLSAVLASALGLLPTSVSATADARARDAADAFSQLCLSMFVGDEPSADPQRFDVTRLSEATQKQIKPNIKASALWDVHAKNSGARMLVYFDPIGICVVEIAEADETSVQDAVGQVAADTASLLNTTAAAQENQTHQVSGLTATTSSWRLLSEDGDVLIMLTTLPEAKFMIQHVVTASHVN